MPKTKIEWTDTTWNPVTGCSPVSAGCDNCYARVMAKRLKAMGLEKYKDGFNVRCHPKELDKPLRWRKPRRIFVNSMSDLFHEKVPFNFINDVLDVVSLCPSHKFQILTKRPERMKPVIHDFKKHRIEFMGEDYIKTMSHLWLGVTAENQKFYDKRSKLLSLIPASVQYISFEPLLSNIELDPGLNLDWAIIGCETGRNKRPCNLEWIRSIVDQCQNAHVPVFVKQLDIDGRVVKDWSDPDFPEDLKLREFPA